MHKWYDEQVSDLRVVRNYEFDMSALYLDMKHDDPAKEYHFKITKNGTTITLLDIECLLDMAKRKFNNG